MAQGFESKNRGGINMLYVNLESGKKPSMEEYGTDYTVNIDCRYEKEFADSDDYCSVDNAIYHTELGNVITNEKLFADNKVWSHTDGIIEEKKSNNESKYCLDIPDPDPIESQPDGDYDYAWYDEDSRVVSDNTTDTVDPEANLSADLKADLAMLRAMGYNPKYETIWGWPAWRCEITVNGQDYGKMQYNSINKYWSVSQACADYANRQGRVLRGTKGSTMYSYDLINYYDVPKGSNRSATYHFVLTDNGFVDVSY